MARFSQTNQMLNLWIRSAFYSCLHIFKKTALLEDSELVKKNDDE